MFRFPMLLLLCRRSRSANVKRRLEDLRPPPKPNYVAVNCCCGCRCRCRRYRYNSVYSFGAINVILASLPGPVLRLVSFFGFSCDRDLGIQLIHKAFEGTHQ